MNDALVELMAKKLEGVLARWYPAHPVLVAELRDTALRVVEEHRWSPIGGGYRCEVCGTEIEPGQQPNQPCNPEARIVELEQDIQGYAYNLDQFRAENEQLRALAKENYTLHESTVAKVQALEAEKEVLIKQRNEAWMSRDRVAQRAAVMGAENERMRKEVDYQAAKHADCCVDRQRLTDLEAGVRKLIQDIQDYLWNPPLIAVHLRALLGEK